MALAPRFLYTLRTGDQFEVRDNHAGTIRGQVMRVPPFLPGHTPGYVKVRIVRPEQLLEIMAGAMEVKPSKFIDLEWSAQTRVFLTRRADAMTEDFSTDDDHGDVSGVGIQRMIRNSRGIEAPVHDRRLMTMAKVAKRADVQKSVSNKPGKSGGDLARVKAATLAKKAAAKASGGTPKPAKAPVHPASPCKCGCGELAKRSFKQGHDGRYYGYLQRVADGRMQFGDLNLTIRKELNTPQAVKKAVEEHNKLKARNKAERG